jgi:hypothetical protein
LTAVPLIVPLFVVPLPLPPPPQPLRSDNEPITIVSASITLRVLNLRIEYILHSLNKFFVANYR